MKQESKEGEELTKEGTSAGGSGAGRYALSYERKYTVSATGCRDKNDRLFGEVVVLEVDAGRSPSCLTSFLGASPSRLRTSRINKPRPSPLRPWVSVGLAP